MTQFSYDFENYTEITETKFMKFSKLFIEVR